MNCFFFFSSWSLKHWKLLRVLTYGYAKIQKFKEIEKHSVNIKIFANFLWRAWIVLNSSNKTAVEATQGQTKLPAIYREDFLWPPPPPPVLLLVCERSFCLFIIYQILGKVMYQSVRFHGPFTSSRNLIFQFWISISVEQLLRR